MDSFDARHVLGDIEDIRHRARADRRATSVPLLVFGGLTVLDAGTRAAFGSAGIAVLLFMVMAPVGFACVALYYRRQEIATGVGSRKGPYAAAALIALLLLLLLPLVAFFGVYAMVGVGLLVIALMQRNLVLGAWAVVYGVVGVLENFYLISNRLYVANHALGLFRGSDGYFSWSSSLVYGTLGTVLIGAGLWARRSEAAPR